jgi:hypothetical protein
MKLTVKLLNSNRFIIEKKKYLFWLPYITYMIELLFFSSMYGTLDSLQLFFACVRNFSYAMICLKVLLDFLCGEYNKKEFVFVALGTAFLVAMTMSSGNKAMLIYWFFIVAARDVDLEKIVKASLFVHFFCMVIITASSAFGIIENRIYIQVGNRMRESLGYQYATDCSNYYFSMILMYIYIKKESISWESIGALALCNILLFYLTDTRNAFMFGNLTLVVAGIWKVSKSLRKNNFIYKASAITVIPLMSCIMIYLSFFYNEKERWMFKLNDIISGRLVLGYNAFKTYGLHLWGQTIQWVGGTVIYTEGLGTYNYVDSSYIQTLLNFGIIFFMLICLLFVVLGWKAAQIDDVYMILVLVVLALHSALDPQLLWMAFNPFIMCYSYLRRKTVH